ncbi:MAG: DUF2145 domain-containing protein [Caulobacter sp.]|nr:DUF2145 domain-containing protein [Caulobacter sp.]
MRAIALAGLLALAPLTISEPAYAQDSSAAAVSGRFTAPEAAAFGKALEKDLAARGARVALVWRSGRPRKAMPAGLAYTHGALWIYREVAAADGRGLKGYAVYNLYHGDGKARPRTVSSLVQDWPTDFMLGSVEDDVAVIVPTPEMQRRLLGLVDSPTYAALHVPSYSLIDSPFDRRHQNCNTFMLDVIAAAAWETGEPAQIALNLKAWFRPSVIKAGPLQRLFGPMIDARLATDDQSGPIVTASYESIAAFMRDNRLSSETYSFRRP